MDDRILVPISLEALAAFGRVEAATGIPIQELVREVVDRAARQLLALEALDRYDEPMP